MIFKLRGPGKRLGLHGGDKRLVHLVLAVDNAAVGDGLVKRHARNLVTLHHFLDDARRRAAEALARRWTSRP